MNKKLRKIYNDKEAKVKTIPVLIIMLFAMFSVMLFTSDIEVEASVPSSFVNYRSITIDSDYFDDDCVDFPIKVYSASWVAGLNETSFSFYDSDNTTELNWELEKYDYSTGELVAWVKVPRIDNTIDTVIILYYSDSNITDGGENYPESTWDNNYEMVQHLDGGSSSEIDDSTSNNNDATGDSGTPAYEQSGRYGVAIDFNDVDSDWLTFGDACSFLSNTVGTIECVVNLDEDSGSDNTIMGFYYGLSNRFIVFVDNTPDVYYGIYFRNGDTTHYCKKETNVTVSEDNWYYFAYTQSGSTNPDINPILWENGAIPSTQGYLSVTPPSEPDGYLYDISDESFFIGDDGYGLGWDGLIDEIRISNIVRNDTWIRASYNSTVNPTSVASMSGEKESSFSSTLIMNDVQFTVQGLKDTTQYANSSGSVYQTGEINVTISGDFYYEEIRINVSDVNNTQIDGNDIFIQFDDDDSGWGANWLQCSDGGNTIIINKTTWDANNYMIGTNPFTADGDSDGYYEIQNNCSIWWHVRVDIPLGITNVTHSNTAMTWNAGRYI